MKPITIKSLYYVGAICLASMAGGPAFAQDAAAKKEDKPAGQTPDSASMSAMLDLAKPGENHKILQDSVGTWSYKIKFWMAPDAPPMESTGMTITRNAMGGRYFISDHSGKMQMPGADGKLQDMEFRGMGIDGYDNVKKKFVSTWIDNMGTGILISEGTLDPDTHKLTYLGEYQPMPGMTAKIKQIITLADKDHRTIEMFETRGDKEVKTMEISYTRAARPGPQLRPKITAPPKPAQ